MQRIRIELAYDGTEYHGWQVQPGLPTIQGTLEGVLASIEGGPVRVEGSGRTDAGVHALAQIAAFTLNNPIPAANLRKAMNRLLPRDIRINQAAPVAAAFHPRFDAVAKSYEYRIFRGEVCPPFEHRYVYHHPFPLDVDRFIAAAPLLEGQHDFTAFAAADDRDETSGSKVRRIWSSCAALEGEHLYYRVRGSGFLKHMVRNILGVLLEVGKHNLAADDVLRRLEPACGIPPGPAVPARGLFLMRVEY